MKTRTVGRAIGGIASVLLFALGLAQTDAGRTVDPATTSLPPLPPNVSMRPAEAARSATNSLLRPRALQVPQTNSAPTPRTFPPPRSTNPAPVLQPFPLAFDAESKTLDAQPGQTNASFTFRFTNASPAEVTIDQVKTSCGCTVAKLPAVPWKLPSGTNGQFDVVADLRGKHGQFSKMVYVYTSKGFKALNVRVNIAEGASGSAGDRLRNLQIATADRQAVFRGDCARCHTDPGVGKKGRELYQGVCGVCHEAEHRATMVPNLGSLNHPTDADHWRNWITHGKAGTLMPAFATIEGGPLTQEQIGSLVDFLVEHFPSRPSVAAPATGQPVPTAK